MKKDLFNDIVYEVMDRGLSQQETIELIKDYHGIKIDFRTKKGKALLQKINKEIERLYDKR